MEKKQDFDELRKQVTDRLELLGQEIKDAVVGSKNVIFDYFDNEVNNRLFTAEQLSNLSVTIDHPLNLSLRTIITDQSDTQSSEQLNVGIVQLTNNNKNISNDNNSEAKSTDTNDYAIPENLPKKESINVAAEALPNTNNEMLSVKKEQSWTCSQLTTELVCSPSQQQLTVADSRTNDNPQQCLVNTETTTDYLNNNNQEKSHLEKQNTLVLQQPQQQPAQDHSQTPQNAVKTVSFRTFTIHIKKENSETITELPINLSAESLLTQPEPESDNGVCSNPTTTENVAATISLNSTVSYEATLPDVSVKAEPNEHDSVEVPIPLSVGVQEVVSEAPPLSIALPEQLNIKRENEHSPNNSVSDDFDMNVETTLAAFEAEAQAQAAISIEEEVEADAEADVEADPEAMSISSEEENIDSLLDSCVFVEDKSTEDDESDEEYLLVNKVPKKNENKEGEKSGQSGPVKKLRPSCSSDLPDESLETPEPVETPKPADVNLQIKDHQGSPSPLQSSIPVHSPTLFPPIIPSPPSVITVSPNSAFERIIPRTPATVSQPSTSTLTSAKTVSLQRTTSVPSQSLDKPKKIAHKRRRSSLSVSPNPIEKKKERTQSVPASKASTRMSTIKIKKPVFNCEPPTETPKINKFSKSTLDQPISNTTEPKSKPIPKVNSTFKISKSTTTTANKSSTLKNKPTATFTRKTAPAPNISSFCSLSTRKSLFGDINSGSDEKDDDVKHESEEDDDDNNWYCTSSSKYNDIKTIKLKCHVSDCDKMFSKKKLHMEHMQTVHNRRPYSCQICPTVTTFQNKDLLKRHMIENHKKGLWKCKNCPVKKSDVFSLDGHYIFNHEKGKFGCTVCNYTADFRIEISKHNLNKHPEFCKKNPKLNFSLNQRTNSYSSDGNGKGSGSSGYHVYYSGNSIDKPPKVRELAVCCLRCSQEFPSNKELNEHMGKEHEILASPCHVRHCTRSFINNRELFAHIERRHRPSEKEKAPATFSLECAFCTKTFRLYEDLSSHTLERHQEGKFTCTACPGNLKVKKTRGEVIAHHDMRHSNKCRVERVFCPEGCGMEFSFESKDESLHWHLKEIHSQKEFLCPCCTASFEKYGHLESHMNNMRDKRLHDGNWLCKYCKKYNGKSYNKLARHIFLDHYKGVFYCAHNDCQGEEVSFMASLRGVVYSHYDKEHLKIEEQAKNESLLKVIGNYWQLEKSVEKFSLDIDERILFAQKQP